MHIRSSVLILALLGGDWAYSATITATTDRSRVAVNESFQIIFKSAGSPDDDPDFAPLQQRLHILNQSRSSSISIVNGNSSRNEQWTLTVTAKQTGVINIPAIQFGRDQSQAISVEVLATRPAAGNSAEEVFIEVAIDEDEPYIQAQVLYTVKLFYTVALNNASLTEPRLTAGDAVVERLGEQDSYQIQRGSKRYQVVERRYAIYPQRSGVITVEPMVLRGRTGRGLFIDPFGPQPQSVVKHSKTVRLKVRPIPASYAGKHWLPTTGVGLSEQWSANPLTIKQGEPITRTLTLQAQALPTSQLPDIDVQFDQRLKSYPDQPELRQTADVKGLSATLKQKAVIIPASVGKYSLPAIKIPWWNTATQQQEYAELPARIIEVVAAAPTPGTPSNVTQAEAATNGNQTAATAVTTVGHQGGIWKGLFFISLAAWLATLLAWWLRRQKTMPAKAERHTLKRLARAVQRACKGNDPQAAKQALLLWARLYWPEQAPASLADVAAQSDPQLRRRIIQLNQCLYGQDQQDWLGDELHQAFIRFINNKPRRVYSGASKLEPLYRL